MSTSPPSIHTLLNSEAIRAFCTKLGIENDSKEAQAKVISALGAVILERIVVELSKRIPESAMSRFKERSNSGEQTAFRRFLEQHVPDIEEFVGNVAETELKAITARARALAAA